MQSTHKYHTGYITLQILALATIHYIILATTYTHHTGYDIHSSYWLRHNIITPAAKATIPAINTPALTYTHHTGYGITSSHRLQKQSYLQFITPATTYTHHTGYDITSSHRLRHTLIILATAYTTHITPAAKAVISATHHTGFDIHSSSSHRLQKQSYQLSSHRL
ncbi:hypothetical protein ACLKA7_005495 [Drosophila subpalustris]